MAKEPKVDASAKVSFEDVIRIVAERCDGARRRDGRGFSKADAPDGHRIHATLKAEIPLCLEGALRARELATIYSGQAAMVLARGDRQRAKGLKDWICGNSFAFRKRWMEVPQLFKYAGLSPGLNEVWLFAPFDTKLHDAVKAIGSQGHGERKIRAYRETNAEVTVNHKTVKVDRWVVDWNATSRDALLPVLERFCFVADTRIHKPLDAELDALMKNQRCAYLAEVTRSRIAAGPREYAVFNLDAEYKPFSQAIKAQVPGRLWCCRPEDDRNWHVLLTPETVPTVIGLLERFGFAASTDLAAKLDQRPTAAPRSPAPK